MQLPALSTATASSTNCDLHAVGLTVHRRNIVGLHEIALESSITTVPLPEAEASTAHSGTVEAEVEADTIVRTERQGRIDMIETIVITITITKTTRSFLTKLQITIGAVSNELE